MKPKRGKSAGRAPKPAYRRIVLPALILTIALIIRTTSLTTFGPLYDEKITKDVVTGIWNGDWSNNWKGTVTNPDYRVDMYNFSSYMYADALLAGMAGKLAPRLPNGDPDFDYWSRLFSALAGTLAVFLFYLVARRWFSEDTAVVAMALMAIIPLLVQDAHYARPEAFVLALTGAAYLFLLRFDSEPGRLRYLGYASFCFGLLIACKVSMIPMAAIPVLFTGRLKDRRLLIRAAGIWAGCMLLGTFIGVPDAFFHPAAYWHGVEFLRKQYAGVTMPHASIDSTNSVSLTAAYFWQTTGLLLAFALAGAVLLAKARRFVVLAATAGPVVFYLAYFASQRTFFERNLSHVVPLMAILAALALTTISQKVPAKARSAVLVALVAVAAGRALWVSSRLVFVAMRTTTERRSFDDQLRLLRRVRGRIDYNTGLATDKQLADMIQLGKTAQHDFLVRVLDFHDSFTRKHLEELERQTNWREVDYFPSIFEGFDVSTLIAYHSVSYRYLFLQVPAGR